MGEDNRGVEGETSDLVARLREPLEIGYAVPLPVCETLQRAADERGEAADEIERLRAKVDFWMRNSERNREQASLNHDCYLRLWAEHGGPELPPRLRDSPPPLS